MKWIPLSENPYSNNLIDLRNRKFGKWTVIERIFISKGKTHWKCICECGNVHHVLSCHLIGGKSTKCKTCHNTLIGHSKKIIKNPRAKKLFKSPRKPVSREYKAWSRMKSRCFNKNVDSYNNYGGRGISVDESWMIFDNFYKDMGLCPSKYTLERLDVNKNYTKLNCIWASTHDQCRNRRNNKKYTLNEMTYVEFDWSKILNIPITSLRRLINKYGWPLPESEINKYKSKYGEKHE